MAEEPNKQTLQITPEFRCTGHCCKRFALEHSLSGLQKEYKIWQSDPAQSKVPDIETIATMVIPLAEDKKNGEYIYTCKHLSAGGDCTIYERRPQMCRDFPGEEGCHFRECTSSRSAYYGVSWWGRILRRYRWLKSLSKAQ